MGGSNSKGQAEDPKLSAEPASHRRPGSVINVEDKSVARKSDLSSVGRKSHLEKSEHNRVEFSRQETHQIEPHDEARDASHAGGLKSMRFDFPVNEGTGKPPRITEREKMIQKKKAELAAVVSPKSNHTEPIEEVKEREEGMTKMDFVFMMERMKELTESVQELNERVTQLEKQNLRPIMEKENKPDPSGDIFIQLSEKPGSAEDLIRKMREQLKKRKPDVSALEETRSLYKKMKMGYVQSNEYSNEGQ